MKGKSEEAYVPFPVGTVRGPYGTGWGSNPRSGGVQFLVQGKGGWVPFLGKFTEEAETRRKAETYAKKEMA
jgi:hypothetical protein